MNASATANFRRDNYEMDCADRLFRFGERPTSDLERLKAHFTACLPLATVRENRIRGEAIVACCIDELAYRAMRS
ncbi:hypothetical protein NKI48_03085 [Mesorhizobium sp. M0644]|uniref:hypothetical protein n=1 Tax=Mesorhizobium sp. M0644 TaxID=2956979 RepID=UPI0033399FAB